MKVLILGGAQFVGRHIAAALLAGGHAPERFVARSAQGYPSGRYGSQRFHRRECGLDPASIVRFLTTEAA
jgi:transketolase